MTTTMYKVKDKNDELVKRGGKSKSANAPRYWNSKDEAQRFAHKIGGSLVYPPNK